MATTVQLNNLVRVAQQRADQAFAVASGKLAAGGGSRTGGASTGSVLNFADRETPTISGGGAILTLAHTPLSDACIQLFRGKDDGYALTLNWTRVGNQITLTVPQIDASEAFRIWYRY